MSDEINAKPPVSFWIIGGAALFWNLFGLFVYYSSVTATPELLASQGYTPDQIDMMMATPAWATSATAVATTAGVLASLALLFRRSWAFALFVISLVALLVQDLYVFVLTDSVATFGVQVLILQTLVLLIAVLLIWYSRHAVHKGYLS